MLDQKGFERGAVEAAIKIGLLFVLAAWCFDIVRPFVTPVVWAMILAVALNPLYLKLKKLVGKGGVAASIMVLIALAIILIPGVKITTAAIDSVAALGKQIQQGSFEIPPPSNAIKNWPLVGETLHAQWSLAASDLQRYLTTYASEVGDIAGKVIGVAGGLMGGLLMFCFSVIIAGVFMANGEKSVHGATLLAKALAGKNGPYLTNLASNTIQSVAKGVLGVAVIQATLLSIGFFAVGVPGAAVWSVLVLVLAIAQLPPVLVVLPLVVYVFNNESTLVASLFAVWSILAGFSENVLKPLLLGRGVDVPMLVILLGSLGGMIMSGFVGLFLGAVILAVSYRLLMAWLELNSEVEPTE
ncbi:MULTISPECIES: AI-2E family transporter [unclassified Agarivorans]|uniref:AI-2E family transporter n=1 Tax=unclassified Agarivorans TaxID=2636026 RepID=UPI0026E44EB8|nr:MULTISPECIES: AI-2E family transporter [unclassified Agarivorans]MDO6685205.1 AI-2E family transporter [Agarivorans sp. 3_MG-2023]MDO6715623.1 AI-2E family transporter [Agarivorans sp. 2_MG-2023]